MWCGRLYRFAHYYKGRRWSVCGIDQKLPLLSETQAEFVRDDLRTREFCQTLLERRFDEVYQSVADMSCTGYISSGARRADNIA
jgi:GDP-D-mannose 3', 5'-epimerase